MISNKNGLEIAAEFHRKQVQGFDYAMAGGFAAAILLAIFTLLNETVLPAHIGQHVFMLATMVTYLVNLRWVFQSERHSRVVEISPQAALFPCISLFFSR